MISKDKLDDVRDMIDRFLIKESGDGEGTPFILIFMEPFADDEHGIGMALRATGNSTEAIAKGMLLSAARGVLECEEHGEQQSPESLQ